MKVKYGKGKTEYGPGVQIKLTGVEVATAILAYLAAHRVYTEGPLTIRVNGQLCGKGSVYVDPAGFVTHRGKVYSGRGKETGIKIKPAPCTDCDE